MLLLGHFFLFKTRLSSLEEHFLPLKIRLFKQKNVFSSS